MRELRGKVAVVTGAASGIGLALARMFAAEHMSVVLADIEDAALDEATRAVAGLGARTLAVRCDVSRLADVEALAARAVETFGAVHVVCNNAGVALSGAAWTYTMDDWQWVLGVNLWGVIHGVRVFTPLLLEQGEGHMVNTASMAGVTAPPNMAAYNVSKHGVVALSETLYQELAAMGSAVKVSVLCPSFTNTRILESARNRPASLADSAAQPNRARDAGVAMLAAGQSAEAVAEAVLAAIRAERFWIFPYEGSHQRIQVRADEMLAGRNPVPLTVEDFAAAKK